LSVQKRIRGKLVVFACNRDLTRKQANEIAKHVQMLSIKFPGDKYAIFKHLRPIAKKLGVKLAERREATCVTRSRDCLSVQKRIRGKLVVFACNRDLTLKQANLLAEVVKQLSETYGSNIDTIFRKLAPYAKKLGVKLTAPKEVSCLQERKSGWHVRRWIQGRYVTFASRLEVNHAQVLAERVHSLAMASEDADTIRRKLQPLADKLGVTLQGTERLPSYVVGSEIKGLYSVRKRFDGKEVTIANNISLSDAVKLGERLRQVLEQHESNMPAIFKSLSSFAEDEGIKITPAVESFRFLKWTQPAKQPAKPPAKRIKVKHEL